MGDNKTPDILMSRLSEFIAERMGLSFPPERWGDLRRGLNGIAKELGFANSAACLDSLLTEPLTAKRLEALANHLTVGETYFFREKKTLDALAESALPELIRARRNNGRRLRLWSAACSTGEEPYSLAILLHQIIPDLGDWNATILATDINERFLRKAAAGVYGEWSFREAPPWLKERYFQALGNGQYKILPEVKRLVTFAKLNLAEESYPTPANDTNAMDVIFCRNALMYFTPAQAAKAVRNLRSALVDDGWLAVSPCETSQALFSRFATANFPGAILYHKSDAKIQASPPLQSESPTLVAANETGEATPTSTWGHIDTAAIVSAERRNLLSPSLSSTGRGEGETGGTWSSSGSKAAVSTDAPSTLLGEAQSLYEQGRYREVAETLLNSDIAREGPNPPVFSLLARALANQGDLAGALAWCDKWIAADKLDASGHYLRAVVLQESGDRDQSLRSFRRAIYLRPDWALAHFAMGNLARAGGDNEEAEKHFNNASRLLRSFQPGDVIPESDGLTAGHLIEIISSIKAQGTTP
ncbi:MAG TPA: CheR family methyltransferase [Verrucomicrobiae bacterium]|jgi:chemotaxis protein methyltransferase CheR